MASTRAKLLVGGAILFIGGAMLFKRMTSRQKFWPLSHCAGLVLFALIGLWAFVGHPEPLTLHFAATAAKAPCNAVP